jgi:hypothetical protein
MRDRLMALARLEGRESVIPEHTAGAGRADLVIDDTAYEFKVDASKPKAAKSAVAQLLSYRTALRVEGREIKRLVLVCWMASEETHAIAKRYRVKVMVFPDVFKLDATDDAPAPLPAAPDPPIPEAPAEKLPDGHFWHDGHCIWPGATCGINITGRMAIEIVAPSDLDPVEAQEIVTEALAWVLTRPPRPVSGIREGG